MYEQLRLWCDGEAELCGCHAHNGFLTLAGYRAVEAAAELRKVQHSPPLDRDAEFRYLDTSVSVSGSQGARS